MPKAAIHPTYYPQAKVTCSCGAAYVMGATKDAMKLDICRECHPFYTGNQKLIDTAGRVDRFREKLAQAETRQSAQKPKKARKPEMAESQSDVLLPPTSNKAVEPEVIETPAEEPSAETVSVSEDTAEPTGDTN